MRFEAISGGLGNFSPRKRAGAACCCCAHPGAGGVPASPRFPAPQWVSLSLPHPETPPAPASAHSSDRLRNCPFNRCFTQNCTPPPPPRGSAVSLRVRGGGGIGYKNTLCSVEGSGGTQTPRRVPWGSARHRQPQAVPGSTWSPRSTTGTT